jgi:hypothetical protein
MENQRKTLEDDLDMGKSAVEALDAKTKKIEAEKAKIQKELDSQERKKEIKLSSSEQVKKLMDIYKNDDANVGTIWSKEREIQM